jgi:hypothetical protein
MEKSSATGVAEQSRATLGYPTRAILKLAPDQIRAAAIDPGDVVEGDEVVGVFGPSEPQGEIHAEILPQPKAHDYRIRTRAQSDAPAYQDAAFAETRAMRLRQSAA